MSSLPPGPPRPPSRADDRLAHAPRPVLAPHARPLRRRLHHPRRAARSVGDARPSRPRQAGLHRRPERAARGRGQQRSSSRCSGARSVLLLDGQEHMAAAQGDAAALPRRAHAGLRRHDPRDRRSDEVASWPAGAAARHPSAHAGADARDHHARRLRHRATSACARRCAGCSTFVGRTSTLDARRCWAARARTSAVFDRVRAPIDALLGELITARRAAPDLEEREDILSMLLGRHRHGRRDAARRAADAARGRPRDHRHRAGVGARAARASPGRVGATARGRRGLPRRRLQGDAAAASRAAGRDPHAQGAVRDRAAIRCPRASPSCRRSTSSTPARTSTRTRSRSARSASWRSRRAPTRGSRSAAACAAASARPSRCSR